MEQKAAATNRKLASPATAAKGRKLYSVDMLQKRQKRLVSGESATNLLPNLGTKTLTRSEIMSGLQAMTGIKCVTSVEKFQLLRRRDEFLSKLRDMDGGPGTRKVTQGTCPDMCPEKERYMRDVKKSVHPYECDNRGQMIPEKMVKDYSRSAADQDMPLEHELRPLKALQTSMDYLIFNIANRMPNANSELARWYDFLWSRTRAIRKDITQQMLQNELAVDLVEKCVRLHIFASFRLGFLDAELFDDKINTENLSKSMQTLRHMYEDLAKQQRFCPNEAEFRSYDIILNLSDFNVRSQVLAYRPSVRESPQVQLALELASTLQNDNYVRFFRLLRQQASFLQACLCYKFFSAVRSVALRVICMAYRLFPLENFVDLLAFDSLDQAMAFLRVIPAANLDAQDPNFIAGTRETLVPSTTMPQLSCAWIEAKATGMTLSQILYNKTSAAVAHADADPQQQQPVNSFSPETNAYVNDPVLHSLFEANGMSPVANSTSREQPSLPQRHPQKETAGIMRFERSPLVEREKEAHNQQQKLSQQQFGNLLSKKTQQQNPMFPTGFSFARAIAQSQQQQSDVPWQSKPPLVQTNTATDFKTTQCALLLNRMLDSQLPPLAQKCYEKAVQSKLAQIRNNLRVERLRSIVRHWISYTKTRRNFRITQQLGCVLLYRTVHKQLANAATKIYSLTYANWRQKLVTDFSVSQGTALLDEVVSNQLHSIVCRVRATQIRDREQRLQQICRNLHRCWLRQFADHWLALTRRNRLLRSITFMVPETSNNDAAIGDETDGPSSSISKGFFHPGLKKLTPERMREMVEQKWHQMEAREEEEQRRRESQSQMALGNGHASGLPSPPQISPAAAIRDLILDGDSFSRDGDGFAADSASKLHLFKPQIRQFTPESMRQMLEQKLQQRQKQLQQQHQRRREEEKSGWNGNGLAIGNDEEEEEDYNSEEQQTSAATSSLSTTTTRLETGPASKRRRFSFL